MKNLLIALVIILPGIFAYGFDVRVISVDSWGYPVLEVGGKIIAGPSADVCLWKYDHDNENLAGQLVSKIYRDEDVEATVLLCALSDRIFNPEKAAVYRDFVEKKYLPPSIYFKVSESEKLRLCSYPPVLRFYLFRYIHRKTMEKKFGFLFDSKVPAFAFELISLGYIYEFNKYVEEVRKGNSVEENLAIDSFALNSEWSENPMLVSVRYMYDENRHMEMLADAGENSFSAKICKIVEEVFKPSCSIYEKAALVEPSLDINIGYLSTSVASIYSDMYIKSKKLGKNPQDLDKILYASYLYLRNKPQYGIGHLLFARYTGLVFIENGEYSKLARIIAYIRETLPVNLRYPILFDKIIHETIEFNQYAELNFQRKFGKSLAEYYPDEYARGCEMARKGFYEDQELEQRFEDSLRRRFEESEKKAEMDASACEAEGM